MEVIRYQNDIGRKDYILFVIKSGRTIFIWRIKILNIIYDFLLYNKNSAIIKNRTVMFFLNSKQYT